MILFQLHKYAVTTGNERALLAQVMFMYNNCGDPSSSLKLWKVHKGTVSYADNKMNPVWSSNERD